MPYQWNMGWRGGLLLACFVFFPVLALVARRKWKLAEIRRAEVMRLVRLAAAEAERAEREASAFVYSVGKTDSVVDGGGIGKPNCAVCHNPTTTRCARCKAVRYCSGTCQITHWRQGHKYDCHPPPIDDHHKRRPNVSNLNEVVGNGSGIDGNVHATNDSFYVDQSALNRDAQSEPSILPSVSADNKFDIEVKEDDADKLLETSSTRSLSSASIISSEFHSDDDGEEHFMSTSKRASIIDPLSRSFSTISASVDMLDNAFSNADVRRASLGQHANEPTTIAGSSSFTSFLSDLKPDSPRINDETDKLTDARISENSREVSPLNSNSNNHDRSKTPRFFESRGQTLESTRTETIIYADSTESQSFHSNHHPEIDTELHSKLNIEVSSTSSYTEAANRIGSDFTETVNLTMGNKIEATSESNKERLKSSSSTHLKIRSASIGRSQSFLRSGSSKVENDPRVSDKSLKLDDSLTNKAFMKQTGQLSTSSSFLRRSQSGLSNYGHGKYNIKMHFPYDNFIRLYNSDKVEMRPCGLVNCGNSCYANAVLQCLAFTRPLAAFLLEGFHAKACPKKGWCFTCEFETLLFKAKNGRSPVSPDGIISHIHDIGSNFGRGREEDAHEFLRYSIDALQSACLKEAGANIVGEFAEETTLIKLIFGGYLRSKIKCMRCHGKSERRERMMDLTIDIHGDIGTLEDALARFTESEVLEGENKYKCGRCNSFERAKKQLTILEAPNVLTIALKRYQSGNYGKLNRIIRFSEYLNLAPYMRDSDDNSPVYRLYAVVVHIDRANATFSGHYVCYVKNAQGKWFETNDDEVKQVELQHVLSQSAYMLLYARCSPRAPSLLRKEMAKKIKPKEHVDVHNSATVSNSTFFQRGNQIDGNHAGNRTGNPPNFAPHDPFDGRFRPPRKVDSSSDVSSLFSCSDEGSSWSTESTKDSAASDDFTDYSSGEPGCTNSPQRPSTGSDGMTWRVSVSSDTNSVDFKVDRDSRRAAAGESGFQGRESLHFLYSVKHYRDLTEQRSSRSGNGWANSNVLVRRSGGGEKTAQTFI